MSPPGERSPAAFDCAGFVPGLIIGFAAKFWLDAVNEKVPHMFT